MFEIDQGTDFTLAAYGAYLALIRAKYESILTFADLLSNRELPGSFCAIRHDVDRKPENAIQMARLEHAMGMRATYYFRVKPHTFKPAIIQAISELGHEVGYHYENMSDCDGNVEAALEDFSLKLKRLRELVPVRTVSMHGRPLKRFDNRDLWRDSERHQRLREHFSILGEVYLDIDYSDIAYINDTGRNWTASASNVRDLVCSNVPASFRSQADLMKYFRGNPHPRLVFQIHPERWSSSWGEWMTQSAVDGFTNLAKFGFQSIYRLTR